MAENLAALSRKKHFDTECRCEDLRVQSLAGRNMSQYLPTAKKKQTGTSGILVSLEALQKLKDAFASSICFACLR